MCQMQQRRGGPRTATCIAWQGAGNGAAQGVEQCADGNSSGKLRPSATCRAWQGAEICAGQGIQQCAGGNTRASPHRDMQSVARCRELRRTAP